MSFGENIAELVEKSQAPQVQKAPRWCRIPLGSVAEILNGYPFASQQFNFERGAPVIRIRDVTSGKTETKYSGEIPEGYWIEAGDYIVGMDGDFNARVWNSERGLLNQRVCKISADLQFLAPSFLAYVLPGYLKLINDHTPSVTVKHLSSRTLQETPIPLPPLAEQRRIVRKLDTLSARSTTARTHLTAIEKLVERYKESVRQQAFIGMMSASWREHAKHDEEGSVLLDRVRRLHKMYWLQMLREKMPADRPKASDAALLKKYQAPEPLTETDQLHGVPQTWTWAAAEEIVEPGAEIVYGIVQPGPKLEKGIPYVRGMDIVNGFIQTGQLLKTSPEIAQKYERASLKGNDILLGIIRATKVAIVPPEIEGANITQGTARFRPSCVISTEFLSHWLSSKTAQSWLHAKYRGIDMPGLNLRDVRRLPVPLPPLEEQREIVRRIETAFAKIDRLAGEAAKALKLLGHLDQRILAKAFAGDLVPQDPNDEPAETLLARIRDARASAPKAKRRRVST